MSSPCCQPDLWNQTSKEYASSSCNFWGFAAAVCALHMDTEGTMLHAPCACATLIIHKSAFFLAVDDHDTDVSVLRDHGGKGLLSRFYYQRNTGLLSRDATH
eukprot:SAG31_NODE_1266_length_9065_cov_44.433939_4_plen_102_part_00